MEFLILTEQEKVTPKEETSTAPTNKKKQTLLRESFEIKEKSHPEKAPKNWQEIWRLINKMREKKDAPVDTLGCASLYDKNETPEVKLFDLSYLLKMQSLQNEHNIHNQQTLSSNLPHKKKKKKFQQNG